MVFFACMNCGEALKKPRVEKHFQFQCRNTISVSCMDCFKDFRGQEYVAHTKCITEAERYGGKDFVPRPSKNKGEQKQQDWILIIQSVIKDSKNVSSAEKSILNTLSNYENVPRKKTKFHNFIKSALGGHVNVAAVESIWGKIEEASKAALENKTNKGKPDEGLQSLESCDKALSQADMLENENNENLSKEYKKAEVNGKQSKKFQNGNDGEMSSDLRIDNKTKHKSEKAKKRKISEDIKMQESAGKTNEEPTCLGELEQNNISSEVSKKPKIDKKSKNFDAVVDDQQNCENIVNNEATFKKFNWNETILKIVRSKEEISLKKLRKKVLAEYQTLSKKAVVEEKAVTKFDKKINKMPEVIFANGKVKLAT